VVPHRPAIEQKGLPMKLPIYTVDTAPAGAKALLEGIAADLGVLPNMAGTVAGSPALLAGFDGLRRAVGATGLDPVHREAAGLAVGVAVDNAYGVAFHSTVLGRLGVADAEIDRMRSGQDPADERTAAICRLARDIALNRGKVPAETVTLVTAAGFSTEDVLDVVAECTFAGLVGVMDNLADRVDLDGFLMPRARLL
jgi:alkylhydroperoxidase family enzyme